MPLNWNEHCLSGFRIVVIRGQVQQQQGCRTRLGLGTGRLVNQQMCLTRNIQYALFGVVVVGWISSETGLILYVSNQVSQHQMIRMLHSYISLRSCRYWVKVDMSFADVFNADKQFFLPSFSADKTELLGNRCQTGLQNPQESMHARN